MKLEVRVQMFRLVAIVSEAWDVLQNMQESLGVVVGFALEAEMETEEYKQVSNLVVEIQHLLAEAMILDARVTEMAFGDKANGDTVDGLLDIVEVFVTRKNELFERYNTYMNKWLVDSGIDPEGDDDDN